MSNKTTAEFDILVFGATSFVGQILCQYMIDNYGLGDGFKWAAAGRSQTKLETLRSDLGAAASELPLFTADAGDEASLLALCERSQLIISTVGPYALYGSPMVKVCAESGTDYCDLTGEATWISDMLEQYEEQAKASGARIVHSCGFDSIPSDLGVLYLQQQASSRFDEACNHIRMRVKAAKGGASGGTIASVLEMASAAASDPVLRKKISNPYLLCNNPDAAVVRQDPMSKPVYESAFGSWSAPFIMAGINTRIVHRSNAVMNYRYGETFRYDEGMMTGKGMAGRLKAFAITAGLGGFMVGAAIKPSRWLLQKILPEPGEGPSPEAQENGFYDMRFFGETESGKTLSVKVTGDRDPGYGSTAKMLSETALCLLQDIPEEDRKGGSWTPATAGGAALIQRLEARAGLSFSVLED